MRQILSSCLSCERCTKQAQTAHSRCVRTDLIPQVYDQSNVDPCPPTAGHLPSLYDFHFDAKRNHWIPWNKLVPEYVHSHEKKFVDILGV